MSYLGPLAIGLVLGAAIVAAVLLRNEAEFRRAWRTRFPKTPAQREASRERLQIALNAVLAVGWASNAFFSDDPLQRVLNLLLCLGFLFLIFRIRRARARNRGRSRGVSIS